MSARFLTTADAEEWTAALPPERSAFGSLGFARAQERAGAGEARLFVVGDVAYPMLLRRLAATLPFSVIVGDAVWDTASPPFTGPLGQGGEVEASGIVERLRAEGVVAEFAHLHPWNADAALVGGKPDREIVWVDLTLDEERLWRESYSKACRKNVNRAEREGVTVREATSADEIAEFHRIYIGTMERNEAEAGYFFERSYFEAIFEEMPGSTRFALAEHQGEVIAATLYLHDADDVYSYLGGADHDYQQLRPTNAVVHDTIAWARDEGKRRLILGGGYRPDDGIFRFKASFSPLRTTLELARRVHLPDDYEALTAAWRAHHGAAGDGAGFFPIYRATPA
jgi:serine/alanine adding enzyme